MTTDSSNEEKKPAKKKAARKQDVKSKKLNKVTEKLQSMGVMPGGEQGAAQQKEPPVADDGRARFPMPLAITISAMAIVILGLALIGNDKSVERRGSASSAPATQAGYPAYHAPTPPPHMQAMVWPAPLSEANRQKLVNASWRRQ